MGKYTWSYFAIISICLLILFLFVVYRPTNEGFAASAVITTFAGSGTTGSQDGQGSSASFNSPASLVFDSLGNLYVTDSLNHLIRKITSTGLVSTFAGSGTAGSQDGQGVAASFNGPTGITIDSQNNLYIVDSVNNKIRKITSTGLVSTIAGSGTASSQDGQGIAASFNGPAGITIDSQNTLYISEYISDKIRKITSTGLVSTITDSDKSTSSYPGLPITVNGVDMESFNGPIGVAIDSQKNLYICDFVSNKIRKITSSGVISIVAGSGVNSSTDGQGVNASFSFPAAITIDSQGNLYVCDYQSNKIRMIDTSYNVKTIAVSSALFDGPTGIAVDKEGNLYISDTNNNKIRKITMNTGTGGSTGGGTGTGTDGSTGGGTGTGTDSNTLPYGTLSTTCSGTSDGSAEGSPTDSSTCVATSCKNNFALSGSSCLECGQGQTSQGGKSSCTNLNCPVNQIGYNHKCVPCAQGSYSPGGAATSCTVCGAGKYINNGVCTSCMPGFFTEKNGETSCTSCPPGKYSGSNASSCINCIAGQYQNAHGQGSCKECIAGTYQSQTGKSNCIYCPAGQFSSKDGSASCTSCPIGTYQSKIGQTNCTKCPVNTYSDIAGNKACTPCPDGTFTEEQGSISSDQCLTSITKSDCVDLYRNSFLSFDKSNPPIGRSLYYDLVPDNFDLLNLNDTISPLDSLSSNLSKCVLNQRLQDRSEVCKENRRIKIDSCGTAITDSRSLLQAYEYVNSKGICVDKSGIPIPYPTLSPPGTTGSPEAVLGHVVSCTDSKDSDTCSYNYPIGGVTHQRNPCTDRNLIYDFDSEQCIDPSIDTVSGSSNKCETYQVFDNVTGKCLNVITPIRAMPPNTKGALVRGDYRDCKTTVMGDCTVVYKTKANDITKYASTSNPCPTASSPENTIFDFDTYSCKAPTQGFTDYVKSQKMNQTNYRLEMPIIS